MSVKLEKIKQTTLEENNDIVKLDPEDLDCCGVNRPVEKVTCTKDTTDCNLCQNSNCCCVVPVNATPIDETAQAVDFAPDPEDPLLSFNINFSDASTSYVQGNSSNITIEDFSESDTGYSGRSYLSSADAQVVRTHFSFAVPDKYADWDLFFLSFRIKIEGSSDENYISMSVRDVDGTTRYSTTQRHSNDWMLLRVGNKSQEISEGRWTVGSSMSIIVDISLGTSGKAYITNGIFNYR